MKKITTLTLARRIKKLLPTMEKNGQYLCWASKDVLLVGDSRHYLTYPELFDAHPKFARFIRIVGRKYENAFNGDPDMYTFKPNKNDIAAWACSTAERLQQLDKFIERLKAESK